MNLSLTRALIFSILIHLIHSNCDAQENNNNIFFEVAPRSGAVLPNDASSTLLKRTFSTGFDISFGKQTFGKKGAEISSLFPAYGITTRYTKYYNEIIGSTFAIYSFINGAFLRTEKIKFGYQFGLGVSLWANHYDPIINPGNEYIGSLINAHLDIGIDCYYELSKNIDLYFKIDFIHSSNGAIRLPNRGINSLNTSIGCRYQLNRKEIPIRNDTLKRSVKEKNVLQITFAPGIRQSKKDYTAHSKHIDKHYYGFMLQALYLRQVRPFLAFGGGIDLLFSDELNRHLPSRERGFRQGLCEGAVAAIELCYGNFLIHGNLGIYLHRNVKAYTIYYERIGVRYLFGTQKNIFIGISIKAHGGSADYIEWTFGYRFLKW